MCFGNARYPLAMARLFSMPDMTILAQSCGTVHLCEHLQDSSGLVVVPISCIWTVVAMFPEMVINQEGQIEETGKFSLMRHAYIELGKYLTDPSEDDDNDI